MREDILKPLLARAIGEEEWINAAFDDKINYIDVEQDNLLRIFLKDGNVREVQFLPPKRGGRPCSEEQKEHMRQVMKAKWTPERKAEMSRKMKQIRSETHWASKRR